MTSHALSEQQSRALRIAVFIATLLVVLRHGVNLHLYYPNGNPWMPVCDANVGFQRLVTSFTNLAIPGFFLISGFLFYQNLQTKEDLLAKWRRRLQTLLLPYFLWNALFLVLWSSLALIPCLTAQMQHTFGVECSLAWVLAKMSIAPICGQFWYIRTLMIFIALTPLLLPFLKSPALSFVLLACLVQIWLPIDTRLFSTEGALFFCIGAHFSIHHFLPDKQPASSWIILLPLLAYALLASLMLNHWLSIPHAVTIGLLLYVGWQICMELAAHPWSDCILQWNHHSFFIYAFHGSILKAFSLQLSRFISHTSINSFVAFWLCVCATLSLGFFFSWTIRHFCPSCYRLLTGGR